VSVGFVAGDRLTAMGCLGRGGGRVARIWAPLSSVRGRGGRRHGDQGRRPRWRGREREREEGSAV
jgi:hypothetical protein